MEYLPTLPQNISGVSAFLGQDFQHSHLVMQKKSSPFQKGPTTSPMKGWHLTILAPFWWTLPKCWINLKFVEPTSKVRNAQYRGQLKCQSTVVAAAVVAVVVFEKSDNSWPFQWHPHMPSWWFFATHVQKKTHDRNYEIPRYGVTKSSKKLWNHQVL